MTNPEEISQNPVPLAPDASAVQVHLGILQDIVSRMASNSVSCKTWCITLVSAILVVIANNTEPNYAWIALLPVLLFGILDAYYLAQERNFRTSYNRFVAKLQRGQATTQDLFNVAPTTDASLVQDSIQAISSFAIYPFYLTLLLMIAITRFIIL
ncbi:hypothetical protein NEA10_12260 [Phormidium yuhuli AB48]|uniref:Uncharacterized protein n=1 Tax=Phormidium yuhuli AB48 TaxID=2940671 RepID=A0ABY5AKC4_9CYAN|nr:hypothetical protein [Phormidium yuhuli]USR89652.1 hypothetical protein NEA10_12260 [Phormidium yuhuli AB48]